MGTGQLVDAVHNLAAASYDDGELDAVLAAVGAGPALDVLMTEVAARCDPPRDVEPFVLLFHIDHHGERLRRALTIGPCGADPVLPDRSAAVIVHTELRTLYWAVFNAVGGTALAYVGQVSGNPALVARYRACYPPDVDLATLCQRHGSDKWGLHRYTRHYERHFTPFRNRCTRILEIGVGGHREAHRGGASLRMWKRYFPRGLVYGIDVFDKSPLDEQRIRTFRGHQADTAFLETVVGETGELDIVIDDGSHINADVLTSFRFLFPHVRDGGLYVIEDLQTSYWPAYGGSSHDLCRPDTTVGFLKTLVDGLNHEEFLPPLARQPTPTDRSVVALHLYHNLAIIEKGDNVEGTLPPERLRVPTVDLPVPVPGRPDGGGR